VHETVDQKAERLLAERAVSNVQVHQYTTTANIKGDHGDYDTIIYPDDLWWCSCMWGQIHAMTGSPCAHARALRLLTEKEN